MSIAVLTGARYFTRISKMNKQTHELKKAFANIFNAAMEQEVTLFKTYDKFGNRVLK